MQERLAARTPAELGSLLTDAGTSQSFRSAATVLATRLGAVLEIDPKLLRANDQLGDLLRIHSDELPFVTSQEWAESGLEGSVVVCSYDIMHIVETQSDKAKWRAKWASLPAPPRNEEAWIDLILSMSVGEFLSFFAEIAKAQATGSDK